MNKLLGTLTTAALLATATAGAQQAAPGPDQVVVFMTRQLNLSDAQRRDITPIIAERQAKLRALRESDTDGRTRRQALRAIIAAGDEQINAVLLPEQQQQYAELERHLIERLQARGTRAP